MYADIHIYIYIYIYVLLHEAAARSRAVYTHGLGSTQGGTHRLRQPG